MYQVGELVVYGVHGVCRIVGQEEKRVDRKNVTYLVLEPVTSAGSRFLVPSQSAAALGKLRPVMTAEAFEELLSSPDASRCGKTGTYHCPSSAPAGPADTVPSAALRFARYS